MLAFYDIIAYKVSLDILIIRQYHGDDRLAQASVGNRHVRLIL